ncbi:CDP-glucose 4,6-dehydratase, partial [Planktomarina temperata]|nr:CDP-glucose 4,6-dehydratase [Planktomarina temperata]
MASWKSTMGNLIPRQINKEFWQSRRVFITGHTGFKGSWLAYWLTQLGADVTGFSLEPNTDPSIYKLLALDNLVKTVFGDIRQINDLRDAMLGARPEVVFHLAAQPIVSDGYKDPVGTFSTNIMGVVNILEVCRILPNPVTTLVISSDKCYQNVGNNKAFTIEDPLGGDDPYSASKAATEIVSASYAASYFNKSPGSVLATARAGNVVGGGDWSLNRLLPDAARSFSNGRPLELRNPNATRPWQHVLEPLYGYMMVVEAMFADRFFAKAWNFGPSDRNNQTVGEMSNLFRSAWGDDAKIEVSDVQQDWKEAITLDLNCSVTNHQLKWKPVLDLEMTVTWTADWYKKVYKNPSVN